jgi:hypothetical protein
VKRGRRFTVAFDTYFEGVLTMPISALSRNAIGVVSAFAMFAVGLTATSQTAARAGASNLAGQSFTQRMRSVASAPRGRGFMKVPDPRTHLVYISDFTSSTLNVFTDAGVQIGQIVNGISTPGGIFVDAKSNVWVTNTSTDDNVLEFARGALNPSRILTDPIGYPADVTMCNNGTVYVADLFDFSNNNTASIQVYPPGATKPSRSLTWKPDFRNPNLTCDAAGNVFLAVDTKQFGYGHSRVVKFPGGLQAGAKDLGIDYGAAGGIKPDNAGNLLVSDIAAQTVVEYTEAGKPTGLTLAVGTPLVGIALSRDGKTLLGAAPNIPGGESWSFPTGKPEVLYTCCSRISLPFTFPYGVGFDPGQNL